MSRDQKVVLSAALVIAGAFLFAIFVEDSPGLLVLVIAVFVVTGSLLSSGGAGGRDSGGGAGYDGRSSGDDGFGDGDGGD